MTIFVFLASLLGAMSIGVPVAFALIFCGNRTKTAPLTIMEFMGYRTFDWGAILAAGEEAERDGTPETDLAAR